MIAWLDKVRYSIGLRLVLLFLAAGLIVVMVVALTFTLAARHRFADNIKPHLVEYREHLLRELGSPPSIQRARELTARLPLEIVIQGPQGEWSSSVRLRGLNSTPEARRPFSRRSLHHRRGYRLFRHESGNYTVYFATPFRAAPPRAAWVLMLAIVSLLCVLFLVYLAIRKLFQPIEQIQEGLSLIGNGDLKHRVPVRRKDELGHLADSVNGMAQRIQRMLDAKRELLLAISHELRSPLTRARVHAEMVEEAARREALVGNLSEMERLIAELLESERLSDGHRALQRTRVDASELVRDLLKESFQDERIDWRVAGPKDILLDAARFRLLVRNLLENALRYNRPEEGRVQLMLTGRPPGGLQLTVRDHGVGIPKDRLPRITEPFFRLDPSRQRGTGGIGLGLYLCRLVTEAHGGTMNITSEVGKGTEVVVEVPQKKGAGRRPEVSEEECKKV